MIKRADDHFDELTLRALYRVITLHSTGSLQATASALGESQSTILRSMDRVGLMFDRFIMDVGGGDLYLDESFCDLSFRQIVAFQDVIFGGSPPENCHDQGYLGLSIKDARIFCALSHAKSVQDAADSMSVGVHVVQAVHRKISKVFCQELYEKTRYVRKLSHHGELASASLESLIEDIKAFDLERYTSIAEPSTKHHFRLLRKYKTYLMHRIAQFKVGLCRLEKAKRSKLRLSSEHEALTKQKSDAEQIISDIDNYLYGSKLIAGPPLRGIFDKWQDCPAVQDRGSVV